MKKKRLRWFIYIVEASDGTFYTGIARDVTKRLQTHDSGKGSRYLRGRGPYTLVHREVRFGLSSALKREVQIKNLTRTQKEELIHASNKP